VPVEARRHGAEVLDAIEKAFDPVAELVDPRAERWRGDTVVERADIGVGTLLGDFDPQRVAVVAPVSEHNAVAREGCEHVLAALTVVSLTLGQLERNREPVTVDDRVDFGRKPAAGTSHATTTTAFFSPLAACW